MQHGCAVIAHAQRPPFMPMLGVFGGKQTAKSLMITRERIVSHRCVSRGFNWKISARPGAQRGCGHVLMPEAEHPLTRHPREGGDLVNTGFSVKRRTAPVAGPQPHGKAAQYWVPAFAGMTADDAAITCLSSQDCATVRGNPGQHLPKANLSFAVKASMEREPDATAASTAASAPNSRTL
jgi:hypothetical protein